ncbi:hypothetical protein IFM89_021939 [Coptis chinensis]|uniref:DOG1 domain-containing protein n=1 Tax=Coptis chinensis TaxID=261450 RepID=A0A835HEH4_9MAGN|nr:hypothetical protein IFM89_021939 [Coptis chinensis]
MEIREVRFGGIEDDREAVVMPSFVSPCGTEGIGTQTSDFDDIISLEDIVGLTENSEIDPTKLSGQAVTSYPPHFGTFNKLAASSDITPSIIRVGSQKFPLQKRLQVNRVSLPTGQFENWGESTMAEASPRTDTSTDGDTEDKNQRFEIVPSAGLAVSDSSDRSKDKTGDQKTLRRLAQNREAARKSRLRKKKFPTGDLGRLRSAFDNCLHLFSRKGSALGCHGAALDRLDVAIANGMFISSSGDQSHSMNGNGALTFDIEYGRWLEEHNRQVNELRAAVNSHAGDGELRIIVDGIMAHYDEIFKLKGNAAKADVFHMLSGMWKTPAERCFLWLGGFRSSELLKQLVGICDLQQSSQQAEDALSQGMEALQQSLAETLASGSPIPSGSSGIVANYMEQLVPRDEDDAPSDHSLHSSSSDVDVAAADPHNRSISNPPSPICGIQTPYHTHGVRERNHSTYSNKNLDFEGEGEGGDLRTHHRQVPNLVPPNQVGNHHHQRNQGGRQENQQAYLTDQAFAPKADRLPQPADNLRQQTLQQMLRILTTRQSARALLAINDYFSRLRALSSLWLARPRE